MLVFLSLECSFLEVVLKTDALAKLGVGDENLLFLAVDKILLVAHVLLRAVQLPLALLVLRELLLKTKILIEVKIEAYLDAAVNRDLEAHHCFVKILRNSELDVLKGRVDHQKVKIRFEHVVLDVQILKHLKQLLEAEPPFARVLELQRDAPHQHPADLDVNLLLDVFSFLVLTNVSVGFLLRR